MAILKIKDQEGNIIDIPAIRGDKGEDGYTPQKGVDYFTDEDIASLNIPSVDQTYSPNSENAQSGKAVAEAIATVGGGSSVPNVGNFIGEVTIDNDETRLIEWTKCADGSPLDFDELLISVEGMADAQRNLCLTTNNEHGSYAYEWSASSPVSLHKDKTYYITWHCKMIGGRWSTLGYTKATAGYVANVQRNYGNQIHEGRQRCVNSLVIGLGWGAFTNGTKIVVYGR